MNDRAHKPLSAAVIYPSQVFVGATLITLGPLIDPILRDLHISLGDAGLLSFAFFIGRLSGVLLLNLGLARVPVKTIMVGCAAVLALGSAGAGLLSVGLAPLLVSLFVTGMAGVIPNAISGVWVAANIKKGMEKAMLGIGAWFALGVVVAPLVVGLALDLGASWRSVFLGQAGFAAVVCIVLACLPIADVRDRENLRGRQLKDLALTHPSLLAVILLSTFLYVFVEGTLYVWLAKFHVDVYGAGPEAAALSVTLLWTGITAGRYLAGPLTRLASPARLLVVFAIIMAVFVGGLALAPNLAASEALSFFAGFGASACWPLISCYIPRFPGWRSGAVFSGMMLVGTMANSLSGYLFASTVDALGFRPAMALWIVPVLALIGLAFVLQRIVRPMGGAVDGVPPAAAAPGEF